MDRLPSATRHDDDDLASLRVKMRDHGASGALDVVRRHGLEDRVTVLVGPVLGRVDPADLARFPKIELVSIDKDFGGWAKAQKTHFDDGGVFDAIYAKK
mgnify:CR=1 FL=1